MGEKKRKKPQIFRIISSEFIHYAQSINILNEHVNLQNKYTLPWE